MKNLYQYDVYDPTKREILHYYGISGPDLEGNDLISFNMRTESSTHAKCIKNKTVILQDVLDSIYVLGGTLDSWTKVHPFSAVHETLMLAMMNDIKNEHVDFLRYVYMTDIDFTELMKKGIATYTKEHTASVVFNDKCDKMYNFHKLEKIPIMEETDDH